ncbi:MAG TPA: hypothetical protein VK445_00635 [Dissulfurispiraceae bacterium]|nr:hypothetical protein [Dissulfurispiraceae bacterium]
MRRTAYYVTAAVLTLAVIAVAWAGSHGSISLKAGDEVFACNCGDACPCKTMSKAAGKCTCGKEMVKAKVMDVKDGVAQLKADGWSEARAFPVKGKFACACGASCPCETVSQAAGKCTCGTEMKEVK